MNSGTLTIYSASAGSGKTFQLARIYLTRLFRSRYNYRKILAVTFTNKATAEMKGRILDQLHRLAKVRNQSISTILSGIPAKVKKKLDEKLPNYCFQSCMIFQGFPYLQSIPFFRK
jgi:ATP-dependent exoDNAse (exonuclease V) beta subunit